MSKSAGSFVRWQAITIAQLGYAVGLVLSFATAALGFALSIVKDGSYCASSWCKVGMMAAAVCQLLSIVLGLWCVTNRLGDFRKSKGIARDREDMEEAQTPKAEIDRKLELRRAETQRMGERTWSLFRFQVTTFVLGGVLLTVTLAVAYRGHQAKEIASAKVTTLVPMPPPAEVGRYVLFQGKDIGKNTGVSPENVASVLYRIDTVTGKTWRFAVARMGAAGQGNEVYAEGWEPVSENDPWGVLRESLPTK